MGWLDKVALAVLLWIAACGLVGVLTIWSANEMLALLLRRCL